ncbi:iron chelate uptake ABC transporter family permease subunit [uncultured Parolsenella sp.]|uniref:FecCD family ABC transporter permease n=1 Tax=uncultured Parolsenella sp. TaxID=2083008 RepID=UPI0027D94866|nr:iron chelate uptake ABC transporter family permease subunit [uncultured Parolsenella sp.]
MRTVLSRRPVAGVLAASATCLVLVAAVSLMVGASSVGPSELLSYLAGGDLSPVARNILVNMRIPRVAAGLLAGASLALSGLLIQTVLDNPLASPSIMGVNSGAGLAVLLVSAVPALGAAGDPARLALAAFGGAALAALAVFAVSARAGVSRLTVVLAGVALNAVFGAGQNAVLTVVPNVYVGTSSFLVGGFSGVLAGDLVAPAALSAVGLAVALALAPTLNLLALGDEGAHALGVNVRTVRIVALASASLLAASAVSFAGLLGFVGLVVPHLVRRVFGTDVRRLAPLCVIWGAAFTVACDTFARTAFAPYEIPVGIPLALLGGPFFIHLIMRGRGYRDE